MVLTSVPEKAVGVASRGASGWSLVSCTLRRRVGAPEGPWVVPHVLYLLERWGWRPVRGLGWSLVSGTYR